MCAAWGWPGSRQSCRRRMCKLLLKHPRKLGGSLEQWKFSLLISRLSDPNMSALQGSLENAALGNFRRFSYSKNVFGWSS